MNDAMADKWIASLRSGKYNQTKETLCRPPFLYIEDSGYCCLGVLCDISGIGEWTNSGGYSFKDGSNQWIVKQDLEHMYPKFGLLSSSGDLPLWQANSSRPADELVHDKYVAGDNQLSLAQLNDYGFTFDQIADIVDYFRKDL